MSQRFVRCPHCSLPHRSTERVCPQTGYSLEPMPSMAPHRASSGNFATRAVAPAPPRDPSDPLIGKTIGGRYVVRGRLGEGGMGTVYAADHITIGRPVAIKVLHPLQAKKETSVKRFQQEARAASSIGHPNICEVYDFGMLDDGSPFLVMERLMGTTLASRIEREGALPIDEVLDALTQVLSGLSAAHDKGILHRDIKPENVFLAFRPGVPPVAKIVDFGVSKFMPSAQAADPELLDLTRTGMVMGTPYYMSPEQARGDRNLDARVDIYACGVMLYEALTGRRPYLAPNYNALLMEILHGRPRSMRELRRDIPPVLEAITARAMARDRAHRFQTAQQLQREIMTLRRQLAPILAVPQPVAGTTLRSAMPRPSSAPPPGPHVPHPLAAQAPRAPARTSRPPPPVPAAGRRPEAGRSSAPPAQGGERWDVPTRVSPHAPSAPPPPPPGADPHAPPPVREHAPFTGVDETVRMNAIDADALLRAHDEAAKKRKR